MYKFIKLSILPPGSIFLLLLFLTIMMWWKRAAKRRWLICLTVIVVLFYVTSAPITTRLLIGSLEGAYPREPLAIDHADAILVLGGGSRYYGPDSLPSYESSDASINRALHAAEIYHQLGGCPIIVSGRDYYNHGESEDVRDIEDPLRANGMSRILLDLGVQPEDIILEEASRSTYENILESKKLIQEKNFKDVILVTDAAHMGRSELCCQKLGVEVTPAPCNYYATALECRPETFFPSGQGIFQFRFAFREYVGMVWYWVKGRI